MQLPGVPDLEKGTWKKKSHGSGVPTLFGATIRFPYNMSR